MKTGEFEPTIAQVLFGQPHEEFEMDDFSCSLFFGVMRQWERVWWNTRQNQFDDWMTGDIGPVHFRPYSWNDESDDGPNFWMEQNPLMIRWYKHPGRGMSCNAILSNDEWRDWHDVTIDAIRSCDVDIGP